MLTENLSKMIMRFIVLVCIAIIVSGCKTMNEQGSENQKVETPADSHPEGQTPQKAASQPENTRGKKPEGLPARFPVAPGGPKKTSHIPRTPSKVPPNTNPNQQSFDASDASIVPADKAHECSGNFLDANKRKLKRVSVWVRVLEDEPSNPVFHLVLDCNYSVITHASPLSTTSKFSCQDIQRAIRSAEVCDGRSSIGEKKDFINRIGQVFNVASMTTSRKLDRRCDQVNVPGTGWLVSLGKPFRPPVGFPEPTTYDIDFKLGAIRVQEFYGATSVDDITCPTELNDGYVKSLQARFSSTITSIMNAIRIH